VGLIGKIREVIGRQTFMQSQEKWSFHRFMVFFFSIDGFKKMIRFAGKVLRYVWRKYFGGPQTEDLVYAKWRKKNMPKKKDFEAYAANVEELKSQPLFSIILPVYEPNISYFKQAIDSVLTQVYTNWELCISDDCSSNNELISYLNELEKNPKIKVHYRTTNGHISANSNSALSMATGDYVCFMDHDDLLTKDALYQFAVAINEDPLADILYSDEDKITNKGRFVQPNFKPQWSPDTFLSRNYLGHFVGLKKSIIDQIDGFRLGFEGSQDYDLLLRATEKATCIKRIPKILYHWRMHEQSTAMNEDAKDYAFLSGVKALDETFQRRGIDAKATLQKGKPGFYRIQYALKSEPKVSIIIPTYNNSAVLSTCIESIFKLTSYPNFEIVLINNNSTEEALFDCIKKWQAAYGDQFRLLDCPYPFNYAKLMNDGVRFSNGSFILLLNNDTEVLHADWIEQMLHHAQRKEVGAVGVKLLYPNDTVQHGGVVMGIGGVAGHTFIGAGKDDPGQFYYLTSVTNYSAVTAACLMVEKSKYEAVGGFDEQLAVEYNDVDFCLKLIDNGYYNLFNPDVVLYHYESLTRGHPYATKESYKKHVAEVKYFKSKWQQYIDNDPFYNPNLSLTTTHFEPDVIL